jgi:succinate-semialdehyde dehydrogenase / glutarate-semialdehyde dehydrogenase
MTLEMGKPLAEAHAELTYAANFFRWYAEEAVRISGRHTVNEAGAGRLLTMKQPVGPCLFITPWNFPLAMGTREIGPAIAAGCSMVVKPAAQTPLSMLMLARILEDAGLPAGGLNIVTTSSPGSIVEPLIRDPRLRKLSFTGSTEIGRLLIEQSADQVLKVSMELSGNAPFLIFEDADLDAAVEGALIATMRNGGEACTAANRFYVHETVADDFARKLADRIGEFKVGRGTEQDVRMGPLIDEAQRTKVADLVDDAVSKGAKVLCGGSRIDGPGYFYAPTVLTTIAPDSDLLAEEIFGPVAPGTDLQ